MLRKSWRVERERERERESLVVWAPLSLSLSLSLSPSLTAHNRIVVYHTVRGREGGETWAGPAFAAEVEERGRRRALAFF